MTGAAGTVGVGMSLTPRGAVLAMVVGDGAGSSLAALADVAWPAGTWSGPGPQREAATVAASRLLATARRRSGLPRWSEVVVVGVPDDALGVVVVGRVAGLLARAGLTLVGVVSPDEARVRQQDGLVGVPPELLERAGRSDGALAVGAALGVRPVPPVTAADVGDPDPVDPEVGGQGVDDLADGDGGWVVEHVAADGRSAVPDVN
jgi:hypothetical protein